MKHLLYIGLILNILETLLISFAFGKNSGEAYQTDDKGRKIYLSSFLHPEWFKWGIYLLVVGFLLQLFYAVVT